MRHVMHRFDLWLWAAKVASFATVIGAIPNLLNPAQWSSFSKQLAGTVFIGLVTATLVKLYTVFVLNKFFPDRSAHRSLVQYLWARRLRRKRNPKRTTLNLKD
jgi:hypothetical protein